MGCSAVAVFRECHSVQIHYKIVSRKRLAPLFNLDSSRGYTLVETLSLASRGGAGVVLRMMDASYYSFRQIGGLAQIQKASFLYYGCSFILLN